MIKCVFLRQAEKQNNETCYNLKEENTEKNLEEK